MKQPDKNQKAAIERVSQKFTAEELQHLSTLPVRKVKFAGQVHSAWYDEKSFSLYLLDENGVPTGEVRVLASPLERKAPPTATDRAKVAVSQAASTIAENETVRHTLDKFPFKKKSANKATPDAVSSNDQPCSKKSAVAKTALLTSIVTAAVFLLLIGVLWFTFFSKDNAPNAADQKVQVVQMAKDILPGEMLDVQSFERVTISSELFNQIALTGSAIYSWERVSSLSGMYAANYVAAGQFLTYSDVQADYSSPTNPFTPILPKDSEFGYLVIPAIFFPEHIDDYMIGRNCDIKVSVQTQVTRPEKLETDDVPGLDHSSSITEQTLTDTYTFQSVPILDVTTIDGTSLYAHLAALNTIPDGELEFYIARLVDELCSFMNEETTVEEVFGRYIIKSITIKLPKEQIKVIGKLDQEHTSVKIDPCFNDEKAAAFTCETEEQKRFVNESKFTAQILATMLSEAIS